MYATGRMMVRTLPRTFISFFSDKLYTLFLILNIASLSKKNKLGDANGRFGSVCIEVRETLILATFGPLPGPRKSRSRAPFTAWTSGPRGHERIIRITRIIRFLKIIGLICIIRIISTISQYFISLGPARRLLRAPGRQDPKNGHFTIGRQ